MNASAGPPPVLIVDRDIAAVEPLRLGLTEAGFSVRAVAGVAGALDIIADMPPRLVVVDWNMPHYGAMELIHVVRGTSTSHRVALIILSSLSAEGDVVNGLTLGADDYVVKPYSVVEMVARVRAVLRPRAKGPGNDLHRYGGLELDSAANRVCVRGRFLNLSPAEYRLLRFFILNPDRAFNRAQLLGKVWTCNGRACHGTGEISERTVDVSVQRLRKLLTEVGCDDYLQTVRGFGYRFQAGAGFLA